MFKANLGYSVRPKRDLGWGDSEIKLINTFVASDNDYLFVVAEFGLSYSIFEIHSALSAVAATLS